MLLELAEPWAILPATFKALHSEAASTRAAGAVEALQARDARPVDFSKFVDMRGDVAILHLKGILARYHSWFSDGPSYGELRKAYQSTIDQGAKAALLVVDSPGGDINGLLELCDAFYRGRSKFRATAVYVAGTGASAAYFLSAAFGSIYCSATSSIGSIGVITTLVDDSEALEEAGLREFEIVSSASPKKSQKPGDSAYRARVQQRIDDIADVFVRAVANYRGVKASTVLDRFGQGDVLVGRRAVDAGLADGVSDVESVIADLQARASGTAFGVLKSNGRAAADGTATTSKGSLMAKIGTPDNPPYTGRDQCASCKSSLNSADVRFCESCRHDRKTDTAARDAGLDVVKYCSGCAKKLAKDDTVYCRADAQVDGDLPPNDKTIRERRDTTKGAVQMKKAAKIEKRRIVLGMSASASAEDVKQAWKARKSAKRAMKAKALGLPSTATKAEVKAAKVAAKAGSGPAPKLAPVVPLWDAVAGRFKTAEEMAALASSNSPEEVRARLEKLKRGA